MMVTVPPPASTQPQVRSRVSRTGTVAKPHTPQPVSDGTSAATDIYAIEMGQAADASSAVANDSAPYKRRGHPRKRKESPTAEMDEDDATDVRRNPKRKAAEASAVATSITATEETRDSYFLLREALRPISPEELQEWEGWCEVESEPAFFNAMLREMGVKNVKVQEVFSVDEDYVVTLPQPVYGFIFLYQYFSENYQDDEAVDGRDLWFANQTTDNACATVALANILMNSSGIDLGGKLEEFKEATKDLSTPLRGHALSSNTFIRSVHNSFTRRMDHLNADLCLEHKSTESFKTKKQRGPSRKKTKKQKITSESGFHFIAYVPANDSVWELDGLKTRPVCLGQLQEGVHWTSLVRPNIQTRMLQFEESALQFNLVALCKSPLASISQSLTGTIRSIDILDRRMSSLGVLEEWDDREPPLRADAREQIAGLGFEPADIDQATIDPTFERKVNDLSLSKMGLDELYSEMFMQLKSQIGEYSAEIVSLREDEDRVQGRKKDHSPAIHCWVQKLADHGVLVDWATSS